MGYHELEHIIMCYSDMLHCIFRCLCYTVDVETVVESVRSFRHCCPDR